MDKRELLDRYEARGGDALYEQAKRLYEAALAEAPDDALLLRDYGYLLECHGRRSLEAALASYERSLVLDPGSEKTRLQLLHAEIGLGRAQDAIVRCRRLLADRPADPASYRCLASAYVAAGDYARAEQAVKDGLAIAPRDARLVELDGDVLAGTDRSQEALARWAQAHELDPENLSPRYSRAFLLRREGRHDDAADEWEAILDWCEARGDELEAEWPRRELEQLHRARARS